MAKRSKSTKSANRQSASKTAKPAPKTPPKPVEAPPKPPDEMLNTLAQDDEIDPDLPRLVEIDEKDEIEEFDYPVEDDEAALERATAAVKGAAPKKKRKPKSSSSVQSKEPKELDRETIARLLAHPTRTVTVEMLRADYEYVLRDIRNMAVLAGVLVIVLIVAALVL